MIEVKNLSKNYGPFQALKEISFKVNKGQIVGFLGPNGAGKTTTMRILTCFMPASKGKATVAGYDVFKESREVRKRIGYLPENIPLYNEMTVTRYLSFMAEIRSIPRKQINVRLDIAIESCGLTERRHQIIGQLSRGFRQRVGLAQALIHDPEVLILDEPTSGLDPLQIVEIRELIKSLGKEHTILFSTHILPEARMTCERLLIINNGKITGDVSLSNGTTVSSLTDNVDRIDAHYNTLTLLLSGGQPDTIIGTLNNIPHVLSVEQSDENMSETYLVHYEMDNDIRPEVAKTVVDSGWNLFEMQLDEMTLEELFLSLTSEPAEKSD